MLSDEKRKIVYRVLPLPLLHYIYPLSSSSSSSSSKLRPSVKLAEKAAITEAASQQARAANQAQNLRQQLGAWMKLIPSFTQPLRVRHSLASCRVSSCYRCCCCQSFSYLLLLLAAAAAKAENLAASEVEASVYIGPVRDLSKLAAKLGRREKCQTQFFSELEVARSLRSAVTLNRLATDRQTLKASSKRTNSRHREKEKGIESKCIAYAYV